MRAILKREIAAYFNSPPGYVFLSVYFLFAGYFFFNYNLYGNSTDMRALFSMLFTVTVFLIPILTMRLMSEDRKLKTDQILLMAPVSSTSVVLGKLIAAVLVYLLAMSITLVMATVLSFMAQPEWPLIIGHFTGLFLVGIVLISIGTLISALTENQIIAAVGGFCVGFFLMLLNSVAVVIKNPAIASIVSGMSLEQRYQPFTLGIFSISNIVFFLSIAALFAFFAVCAFEKRRY